MSSLTQSETRRFSLATAVRRRWALVSLCTALMTLAGLVVGVVVRPIYTTTTQLLVGSPNATAEAIPGFAAATQSLASSYSVAASSAAVVVPTARRVKLPVATVGQDLSVTPVPNSNIITIYASGSSQSAAEKLAAAASAQLRSYVGQSQAQNGSATSQLQSYSVAVNSLVKAQSRLHALQVAGRSQTSPEYTAAQAAVDVAQLKVEALDSAYTSTLQEDQAAAGISVLAAPQGATSNRSSTAEKAALVGLLTGAILGALLAFIVERRRGHRIVLDVGTP